VMTKVDNLRRSTLERITSSIGVWDAMTLVVVENGRFANDNTDLRSIKAVVRKKLETNLP
jgi:hypothetical protein